MGTIVFDAIIGNETKQVRLTQPQGSGGVYHIMVGDHFHGVVTKMLDGWHVYPNIKSWLTVEDCEAILAEVNKHASAEGLK